MQYAKTMDECVEFLRDGNSGDYANSWLFGDTNTNEILRIELGLKYDNVERTKNGFFIGFNATYDPRMDKIVLGWLLLSEEDAVLALDLMAEELTLGLRAGERNPKLGNQCLDMLLAIKALQNAKKKNNG